MLSVLRTPFSNGDILCRSYALVSSDGLGSLRTGVQGIVFVVAYADSRFLRAEQRIVIAAHMPVSTEQNKDG